MHLPPKPARFLIGVLLFFSATAIGAEKTPHDLASPVFVSDGTFCLGGVPASLASRFGERGEEATVWGALCPVIPSAGRVESTPFLAPATLSVFLAGDVGSPGLRLALRHVTDGGQIELRSKSIPGDAWQQNDFAVPPDWVSTPVQMIGERDALAESKWFGFTAPVLPYSSVAAGMIRTDRAQGGFCHEGAFPLMPWVGGGPPPGSLIRRSYCESGDDNTGWTASNVFAADSYLTLYLAGYPSTPGIRLAVENLQTGEQLPLQVTKPPRERWRLDSFPLPASWRGQPVRVLAEDEAARPGGWLAFAEVRPLEIGVQMSFAFRLLALTLFLFLLTSLPALSACILASWRGVKRALDFVAIALLAICLVGYLAFWIYFLSHLAGMIFSYLVLISACACIIGSLGRERRRSTWMPLRPLLTPLLLVLLASVFVTSVGFVYGKPMSIQDYSSRRFGPPALSIDNFIPKIFADAVFQQHIPVPFLGDWLSSDRPPLQSGMLLWSYPWLHGDRDLSSQIVGTILQLTSMAALWAYLDTAGVNRKTASLVLAAALFSGFTIFNSFFTWPKLLPAGLLLIILGYLFTSRYIAIRSDVRVAVIVGAAAAFAMLSHGGSAFGLLGLVLTLPILRRLPGPRFTVAAIVVAGILYLPWALYQKYYDPPGDRLLKMHLAGTLEPRPEVTFLHLLATNYHKLSWHEVGSNKFENLSSVFDTQPFWSHVGVLLEGVFTGDTERQGAAVTALREPAFYRWNRSIDLFSFAPPAYLVCLVFRRRRSTEFQQSWFLWLYVAMTIIVWCLVMFGPYTTAVHQGCYATELAAIAAAILAVWSISPASTYCLVILHIALNLATYVLLTPARPIGVATFMGPVNTALCAVSGFAAAATVLVLWKFARQRAT